MKFSRLPTLLGLFVLLSWACTESPTVAPSDESAEFTVESSEVTLSKTPGDNDGDGIPNKDDPCPKDPTNTCDDDGGSSSGPSEKCALKFDLTVRLGDPVYDDGDGSTPRVYQDGVDKVLVFTSSGGDGWRFDTDGMSNKGVRLLGINLAGVTATDQRDGLVKNVADIAGLPTDALYSADNRFQPDELNLCTIPELETETVTLGLGIGPSSDPDFPYGVTIRYGPNVGCETAEPVSVYRASATRWVFSGTEACIRGGGPDVTATSSIFELPFEFTLDQQL